ncbi:MAG: acyl-CoA dehydrogenase [Nocardioides sp.]
MVSGNIDTAWARGGPVLLGHPTDADHEVLDNLLTTVPEGRDVVALVDWAEKIGPLVPAPGQGRTLTRWTAMATIAARDLVAARVLEPHLDARAILEEARDLREPHADSTGGSWGVWAAEGPGARLNATPNGSGWLLDGTKPWCSLAGHVTQGLVTAWVDDHRRGLFAVDTHHPGFVVDDSTWTPVGLHEVATATVTMRSVAARQVGGPGWYLERPGFAWGGLGVAAVWYGGAVAVARRLVTAATHRPPDDVALLHLGSVHARLTAARVALTAAAADVDAGRAEGRDGALLAAQVRHVVAEAAEETLTRTARGLGPGPLSQEPEHAQRVHDLGLYLRQHHAERDTVALGRMVLHHLSPGPVA